MIAIVVVPVLSPLAVPIPPLIVIPMVVVIVMAARRVPVPLIVAAALPIRLDPIGICERRTRPVTVVPDPTPVSWIPIAFNPVIGGPGLSRHAIRSWRRWWPAE